MFSEFRQRGKAISALFMALYCCAVFFSGFLHTHGEGQFFPKKARAEFSKSSNTSAKGCLACSFHQNNYDAPSIPGFVAYVHHTLFAEHFPDFSANAQFAELSSLYLRGPPEA